MGLSKDEVLSRFDEIEAFAEIGVAIDRPVKTYSSGMMMRLAFAVQVALDPDILIVDEALSVGDYFFQQKCFERLRKMRDCGLTLLFVSHDMSMVRDLCKSVVLLRKGRVMFDGESSAGIQRYLQAGSTIDEWTDGQDAFAAAKVGAAEEDSGASNDPGLAAPDFKINIFKSPDLLHALGACRPDGVHQTRTLVVKNTIALADVANRDGDITHAYTMSAKLGRSRLNST